MLSEDAAGAATLFGSAWLSGDLDQSLVVADALADGTRVLPPARPVMDHEALLLPPGVGHRQVAPAPDAELRHCTQDRKFRARQRFAGVIV